MERESYCENGITKTGEFPSRTIRNLGSKKEVNGNDKKSYKEVVQQRKEKSIKTEGWNNIWLEAKNIQLN